MYNMRDIIGRLGRSVFTFSLWCGGLLLTAGIPAMIFVDVSPLEWLSVVLAFAVGAAWFVLGLLRLADFIYDWSTASRDERHHSDPTTSQGINQRGDS